MNILLLYVHIYVGGGGGGDNWWFPDLTKTFNVFFSWAMFK